MSHSAKIFPWMLAAILVSTGCTESTEPTSQVAGTGTEFLLVDSPANAQGVAQARETAPDEEEVTVAGRIGGSGAPFVEGIAAFSIVDEELKWCADDEGCPTPWDYCCSDKKGKLAVVKIVGPDGQPLSEDARALLGVKELSKVVVRGKAQRDDHGNLTVQAEKVHVAEY